MKQNITTHVAVAYSHCPRKAFLLLSGTKAGKHHEYVEILAQKQRVAQAAYLDKLSQKENDIHSYTSHSLESKSTLITNALLQADRLEADCGLLTKVATHSTLGHYSYEPTIFVGTYSISKEQKLALFFTAHVLEKLQNKQPTIGHIVNVEGKSHKIKLDGRAQTLLPILEPLNEWLAEDAPEEPPVILNRHCPLCQFRDACRAKAEQENNLSLLDRMTPKTMRKLERKGIFTVTQLSYTFRPRKRKKRTKNPPPLTHRLELQALAIREKKIYIQELPQIERKPVELFLDIEGIPDQNLYYLIGLLVCQGEATEHHSFWADTSADEAQIWQQFVEKAGEYPDAPIYHYGNYEVKALKKLANRYETDAEALIKRLVNVNGFIYGKVYFPTYSNRLKDLGQFIGVEWSSAEASGLQSLVWRYWWEERHSANNQDLLEAYNIEDCTVLKVLTDVLSTISSSPDVVTESDLANNQKQSTNEVNDPIHKQFDSILKFANFEYDDQKISFEDNGEKPANEKERPVKRQIYVRSKPKPTKTVEVSLHKECLYDGIVLQPSERTVQHVIIDLVFTKNGIRRTVIKYVWIMGYCPKCKKYYHPSDVQNLTQQVFGHNFQSWLVYQRMFLRLPYRIIAQLVEEQFAECITGGTITNTIRRFANFYSDTNQTLIKRILSSHFVHADETIVNIRGVEQYVWVFTDGQHIYFRLTETREASIVHEILRDYEGVLISDFYPGYDSVGCTQQKCWVHLIRDINNDLWGSPNDAEFEIFVVEVKNLIIPIMKDVQKYGLKKRNLNKFNKQVDRFYKRVIFHRYYKSELALKYQKRFAKYQNSLFTFLQHDGIAWHNNTAERSIRHLAVQRKISGYFHKGLIQEYLILLGIMQTCRFQEKSFLRFLLSKQKDIDAFRGPKRAKQTRLASKNKK